MDWIVCGAGLRDHCKPLFVKMGILTLPSMFALACLLSVKKNIAGFKSHSDIHNYPTGNNNNIYMKRYTVWPRKKYTEIIYLSLFQFT